LLKRALGYKFTEVTKERVIDYDPETGEATGSHYENERPLTTIIKGLSICDKRG